MSNLNYIRHDDVWKNINELIAKRVGVSSVYLDLHNRHTRLEVTITNPTPNNEGVVSKYGYVHVYITVLDDDHIRRLEIEVAWRYDCTKPIDLFKHNDEMVYHHLLPVKAIQKFEGAKK